jgi:hypothetical protein
MTIFRRLPVEGQQEYVEVAAGDYPPLTEWDWKFDGRGDQPYRVSQKGKRVPLFHDVLARMIAGGETMPLFTRRTLRQLFETSPWYHTYYWCARQQRKHGGAYGLIPPAPMDLLASAMATALVSYFDWRTDGNRVVWVSHERGTEVGRFVPISAPAPSYPTLSSWMTQEQTGDFMETDNGVRPMRYEDWVAGGILSVWYEHYKEENPEEPLPVEEAISIFEDTPFSTPRLLMLAQNTIGTYELP